MAPKVICLGLSRTGTLSLTAALEQLGFGPCYHMKNILIDQDTKALQMWYSLGHGTATVDDIRNHLKEFDSVMDVPPVIYFEKLYEAYPDAKFVLTIREPAAWAQSMRNTLFSFWKNIHEHRDFDPFLAELDRFLNEEVLKRYHQGRLYTHTEEEIIAHNKRVQNTIPINKLLVFEINQGWKPLCDFLGVEKPDTEFPHINDSEQFHIVTGLWLDSFKK